MNNRESEIFDAARAMGDPLRRKEFLLKECGDDAKLVARLEALLAADGEPTDWLDLACETEIPPPVTITAGTQIGPYKLLQKIGEGGMGVVFLARQSDPIRRTVALKVIKPGLDSGGVIARFEAERQALARMDHPNIARVLDGGTTDGGQPFFVMELVKGIPITKFCDEHRLTTQERLELFIPVCHAIQHAHQKGVIHRDLKPSNVLVTQYDDEAVPKIIDFGVAKAIDDPLTEKTLFTAFGQVVGTLDYMSPEQTKFNQLDVDTRSDIYSLGVLLYELLTGLTPFDRQRMSDAAIDQWMRMIREDDPPRPSLRLESSETRPAQARHRRTDPRELTRQLLGDLDWIVMKALEKDRARRYDTANDLASDLRRHLCDEPVSACPPSAGYRFHKFAKRNRVGLAVATTAFLAILGITAASLIAAKRFAVLLTEQTRLREAADLSREQMLSQRDRAERQGKRAEAEASRATENFRLARSAVEQFLTEASESDLASIPGAQPVRKRLLESALDFYENLTRQSQSSELKHELARAYRQLALIRRELNQPKLASEDLQRSIDLYRTLSNEESQSTGVLAGLAESLFHHGELFESKSLCQRALQIDPHGIRTLDLLGDVNNAMALSASDDSQSLTLHREAYKTREQLMTAHPDNPTFAAKFGGTLNNVANILLDRGQNEAALKDYLSAAKHLRSAFERSPQTILWGDWLCNALGNASRVEEAAKRCDSAASRLTQIVEVRRIQAARHPAIADFRTKHLTSLQELASHHAGHGKTADNQRVLKQMRDALELFPRRTTDDLLGLAAIYSGLSKSPDTTGDKTREQKENQSLAMQTLKIAIDRGFNDLNRLRQDPRFEHLRSDPGFESAVIKMTLDAEEESQKVQALETDTRMAEANKAEPNHASSAEIVPAHVAAVSAESRKANEIERFLSARASQQDPDERREQRNEVLELRIKATDANPGDASLWISELKTAAQLAGDYWRAGKFVEFHRSAKEFSTRVERAGDLHLENKTALAEFAREYRGVCDLYGRLNLWDEASRDVEAMVKSGKIWRTKYDGRYTGSLAASGKFQMQAEFLRLYDKTFGLEKTNRVDRPLWAAAMNPVSNVPDVRLTKLALDFLRKPLDESSDTKRSGSLGDRFRAATHFAKRKPEFALAFMMPPSSDLLCYHGASYRYWIAIAKHANGETKEAERWFHLGEDRYLQQSRAVLVSPKPVVPEWHSMRDFYTLAEDQRLRQMAWETLKPNSPYRDPWRFLRQTRAYHLIGEQQRANDALERAKNDAMDDPLALAFCAHTLSRNARPHDEIDAAWDEVLNETNKSPDVWILAGRDFAERGNQIRADQCYAKAATLAGDDLNPFLRAGLWAAGPYTGSLYAFRSPQVITDPSAPVDVAGDGNVIKPLAAPWPTVPAWNRQEFSPETTLDSNSGMVYLMTHLYSHRERTETVHFMTRFNKERDGIAVWLNGQLVFRSNEAVRDDVGENIPITLVPGRNTLVIKTPLAKTPSDFSLTIRFGGSPDVEALHLARQRRWSEAARAINENAGDWDPWIATGQYVAAARIAVLGGGEDSVYFERFGENLAMTAVCGPDRHRMYRAVELIALRGGELFAGHRADFIKTLERLRESSEGNLKGFISRPLVLCYLADGNFDSAERLIARASPGLNGLLLECLRARVLHTTERREEALETLAAAFRMVENKPDAVRDVQCGSGQQWERYAIHDLYLKTTERLLTGNTERFDQLMASDLTRAPQSTDAIEGDTEAFDYFVRVSPPGPLRSMAHQLRGQRYHQLGHHRLAKEEFDRALEISPNSCDLLIARATFLADTGELSRASDDVTSAKSLAASLPKETIYHVNARIDSIVRARPMLCRKLCERDPLSIDWINAKIAIAFREGNWREAIETARQYSGASPPIREQLCIASMLGDPELEHEALDRFFGHFGSIDDPFPGQPSSRAESHINTLSASSLAAEHRSLFEKLLPLAQSGEKWNAGARYAAGVALMRLGKNDEAIGRLKVSANDFGLETNRDAYGRLGMRWASLALAHHRAGDSAESRRWLDRCRRWIDESQRRRDQWLTGDVDAGACFDDTFHFPSYAIIRQAMLEIDGTAPDGFPLGR